MMQILKKSGQSFTKYPSNVIRGVLTGETLSGRKLLYTIAFDTVCERLL
jgi:hypothetical protein